MRIVDSLHERLDARSLLDFLGTHSLCDFQRLLLNSDNNAVSVWFLLGSLIEIYSTVSHTMIYKKKETQKQDSCEDRQWMDGTKLASIHPSNPDILSSQIIKIYMELILIFHNNGLLSCISSTGNDNHLVRSKDLGHWLNYRGINLEGLFPNLPSH